MIRKEDFRKFYDDTYDSSFMEAHMSSDYDWVDKCSASLVEVVKAGSVLDLGCGPGRWMAAAKAAGCDEVMGVEYNLELIRKSIPMILRGSIVEGDVSSPLDFGRKFDCVWSFKVAEHLPPEGSQTFVDNLVRHAERLVIMTAGWPGQGGLGHINCRPKAD